MMARPLAIIEKGLSRFKKPSWIILGTFDSENDVEYMIISSAADA
jgi:hypothetical protein